MAKHYGLKHGIAKNWYSAIIGNFGQNGISHHQHQSVQQQQQQHQVPPPPQPMQPPQSVFRPPAPPTPSQESNQSMDEGDSFDDSFDELEALSQLTNTTSSDQYSEQSQPELEQSQPDANPEKERSSSPKLPHSADGHYDCKFCSMKHRGQSEYLKHLSKVKLIDFCHCNFYVKSILTHYLFDSRFTSSTNY